MKAVDLEFTQHPGPGKTFHTECVSNMKRMRSTFLLLSLLRVVHGVNGAGALGWASSLPRTLAFISHDYPLTTTARSFLREELWGSIPEGEAKICGDCFLIWIDKIRADWGDCAGGINTLLANNAVSQRFDIGKFHFFVDNLLKYDP